MADSDTETREPDGTEDASDADAGSAQHPSPTAVATDVPLPDFNELQKNISETRKQAGPELPDASAGAVGTAVEAEEDATGPTDPS